MLDHLRPKYAKAFRCIGPECEDTCCHGWNVVIDKPTYEKYRANPRLWPVASSQLVQITRDASDLQYARIKLTASYECPFLAADRLCSIQKEHGEDYLSKGCALYPRVTRRISGLMENALFLSCPEAARLVLLNPNLMQVDAAVQGDRSPYYRLLLPAATASSFSQIRNPQDCLWEVRGLVLLLLQDRRYALWQRVFILGMFCKRLLQIIREQKVGLLPQLLRDYAEIIEQGKLRSAIDGIAGQSALQLAAVLEVIQRHGDPKIGDPSQVRFRECLQDFLQGIAYQPGLSPGAQTERCAQCYEEAHDRYYVPFMHEHPYVLENYLINYVFRTNFPFGAAPQANAGDPQNEYLMMCIQFAAIKGLLIGMSGHYRNEFAAGHVVKLVQSFSKAVEHCPAFLESSNPRMASADGMAVLLKN